MGCILCIYIDTSLPTRGRYRLTSSRTQSPPPPHYRVVTGNFVPLILVNGSESLKKKHTIVINQCVQYVAFCTKNRRFFICTPPSDLIHHTDYLRNGARSTRMFCHSVSMAPSRTEVTYPPIKQYRPWRFEGCRRAPGGARTAISLRSRSQMGRETIEMLTRTRDGPTRETPTNQHAVTSFGPSDWC